MVSAELETPPRASDRRAGTKHLAVVSVPSLHCRAYPRRKGALDRRSLRERVGYKGWALRRIQFCPAHSTISCTPSAARSLIPFLSNITDVLLSPVSFALLLDRT